MTAQIAAQTRQWLASAPPVSEDAGAALMDVVARALTAAASRPPAGPEHTQLLKACAGVLNHAGKVTNCHKTARALAAATAYSSTAAAAEAAAAMDKDLAEFTLALARAAGQVAQRYRVDKDFNADTLRGVTQALRRCLCPAVVTAAAQAASLPPDKVTALRVFAAESSWVLVARGAEVFHASGAEAAAATAGGREARDGLQDLRALLLSTHADCPDLPISKGIDAVSASSLPIWRFARPCVPSH